MTRRKEKNTEIQEIEKKKKEKLKKSRLLKKLFEKKMKTQERSLLKENAFSLKRIVPFVLLKFF